MSKSKAIAIKMSNLKFFLSDFISHNKFKIIIGLFVILIGVLTGIFTALKSEDCKLLSFDYLIYDFVDGELHTLPVMLSRLLSCEVVFVIISISAITIRSNLPLAAPAIKIPVWIGPIPIPRNVLIFYTSFFLHLTAELFCLRFA